MNDKEYLFGFEYRHYCIRCPGIRRRIYRYYYAGGAPQPTAYEFPCRGCSMLSLQGTGWLIYER